MSKTKANDMEKPEGEVLCEVCGSVMVTEDGQTICPHCDVKIDFFGDEDENDAE